MWQFDFHIYYQGGQAVLVGASPYTVDGFFHPYPMAVLFAPFAVLPESASYFLYLALCVTLLWRVLGKRALWIWLTFPVFYSLFVGQVDLLFALLMSLGGTWTLPLALARPQLGFIIVPWALRTDGWKGARRASVVSLLLLGLCFLLRPNWVSEWSAVTPLLSAYSRHDSNLYWFISKEWKTILTLIISPLVWLVSFFLRERRDSWTFLHLFTPVTNVYSAALLAEWITPLEIILSWGAVFWVNGLLHDGAPMFVIGISILLKRVVEVWKDGWWKR
jgi:hypothetical protein